MLPSTPVWPLDTRSVLGLRRPTGRESTLSSSTSPGWCPRHMVSITQKDPGLRVLAD